VWVDVQVCPVPKNRGKADLRRGETGTSPQHRIKSYILHRVELRISDDRALKVAGSTREIPHIVLERRVRGKLTEGPGNRPPNEWEKSAAGILSRRKRALQEQGCLTLGEGPNGATCRMGCGTLFDILISRII